MFIVHIRTVGIYKNNYAKSKINRQTAINTIELDVVLDKELNNHEKTIIKEQIANYLEEGLTIIINNIHSIPKHPSGKIQPFISEIEFKEFNLN